MMRACFLLLLCVACASSEQSRPTPDTRGKAETETPENQLTVTEPNTSEFEDEEQIRRVTVYYGHPKVEGMIPQAREIFRHEDETFMIKQVIDQLSIPPADGSGVPLWPTNTYVREVFLLEDGTVVVDFRANFVASVNAGATTEELMIYSLVNSLLESFPAYDKVRILIDGSARETFLGHIDTEFPLRRRYGMYTIVPEQDPDDEIIVEELLEENLQ